MSSKGKILIVDDDPDALDTMAAILETRDYLVLTATSGLEGVNKARAEKPDLIILDVMMPELDGFEACKMIKESGEIKADAGDWRRRRRDGSSEDRGHRGTPSHPL